MAPTDRRWKPMRHPGSILSLLVGGFLLALAAAPAASDIGFVVRQALPNPELEGVPGVGNGFLISGRPGAELAPGQGVEGSQAVNLAKGDVTRVYGALGRLTLQPDRKTLVGDVEDFSIHFRIPNALTNAVRFQYFIAVDVDGNGYADLCWVHTPETLLSPTLAPDEVLAPTGSEWKTIHYTDQTRFLPGDANCPGPAEPVPDEVPFGVLRKAFPLATYLRGYVQTNPFVETWPAAQPVYVDDVALTVNELQGVPTTAPGVSVPPVGGNNPATANSTSGSNPLDPDGDGVWTPSDNCPNAANADQVNIDGDALGDACDDDIDGDGYPNANETAAGSNPRDSSSVPGDVDGDGVRNGADNCPETWNPTQADLDGDGEGDACDLAPDSGPAADFDHDAVPNGVDNCPDVPNSDQADSDSNGRGDACDVGAPPSWGDGKPADAKQAPPPEALPAVHHGLPAISSPISAAAAAATVVLGRRARRP